MPTQVDEDEEEMLKTYLIFVLFFTLTHFKA